MMHSYDDGAAESVQYLEIPVFRPAAIPENPETGIPVCLESIPKPAETLDSISDTTIGISGRRGALLTLSILAPLAIVICYQPVVGLVILVSAGLYLVNNYIDKQAAEWGGK